MTKPGTPPNTSLILSKAELTHINLYFNGSKSAAIHTTLGASMSTIESIRSEYGPNVAHIAAISGATGIQQLGDGGEGEMHATFFALTGPGDKFPIRGATTNADPLWEDEDSQAFADLAEACGVEI